MKFFIFKSLSMKKYLYFFLLVILASACSSDDDLGSNIPKEYKESVVNPDYVNIDWDKTRLISADPDKGVFTFSNNEITNKLRTGNVLTIDADTTGYIVVVTQAKTDDSGNISVKTKQGDLCDIFANTEFTLALSSEVPSQKSMTGNNVYYPVKVVYRGQNGKVQKISTKGEEYFKQTLLKCDTDMAKNPKSVFFESKNAKIYMEKARLALDLSMYIKPSFGMRTKKQALDESYAQYRSKALGVEAYVEGSANTDFMFRADASYSKVIKDKNGDYENIGHNLIRPFDVWFNIQGVPILITCSAELFRGDSLKLDYQGTFKTGFQTETKAKIGLDWSQKNGVKIIKGFNQETNFTYPTIEGKGSVMGRAYLFPRVFACIYNLVGPSFDIKPYVGVEAKGGFRQTLSPSTNPDDYQAWSLRNFIGVDAVAALSMKWMNYEVERVETPPFRLLEWDLYNSPSKIEVNNPYITVTPGQKETVTFTVYDTDILRKHVPTPLCQVVKFESNGILSSRYAYTTMFKNGVVSVDWTPVSKDDYLRAVLYDPDGNVIDEAIIGTKKEEREKLLTSLESSYGSFTFQYDNKGRVTHFTMTEGNGKTTIGYDPFSIISSEYDEDEGSVTTKYSNFKFNSDGRIASLQAKSSDGDSWTQTFSYNSDGYLTGDVQKYYDGFVDKMTMEWKDGNLMKMTDTGYDGNKIEETESYTMTYDSPVNYKHQVSYSQMIGSMGIVAYQTSQIFGTLCSEKLPVAICNYYKYYGSESGDEEDADVENFTFGYTFDDNSYIKTETVTAPYYGTSTVYYGYDNNAAQKVVKRSRKLGNLTKGKRKTRRHSALPMFMMMR